MSTRNVLMALGGSVLLSVAGAAGASDTQSVQAELAALKAEVAQLKGQQQDNWLNERRAEEVKSLVREVLADADTRASLLEGGMTAGHNGKQFFLASEDGSFLMNVGGQIQIRYIWNSREDDDDTVGTIDEDVAGFQLRRTKLAFSGHVGSPKIGYEIVLAANRNTNTVIAEDVVVSYDLTDTMEIAAGRFKLPFLREELVSSKRQLAVERSLVNEIFTLNRGEGIRLTWAAMENLVIAASLSDGAQSGEGGTGDFQNDSTDFTATVRADLALAGSLKQGADFSAWSGEETSIIIGAAMLWEEGETGTTPANQPKEVFAWTADASLEVAGFNLFGAVMNNHDNTTGDTFDHWGYLVQAGYMVIPDKLEPFVRWEHIDMDYAGADEVDLLTFGANYYLNKHNAKFTLDLVWAFDSLDGTNSASTWTGSGLSSGLGLLTDDGDEDDQIALRAQFQLLF